MRQTNKRIRAKMAYVQSMQDLHQANERSAATEIHSTDWGRAATGRLFDVIAADGYDGRIRVDVTIPITGEQVTRSIHPDQWHEVEAMRQRATYFTDYRTAAKVAA
jgi:hypothetical protein